MRMKVGIIFGWFFSFFLVAVLAGCGDTVKPVSAQGPAVTGLDTMQQAGLGYYWDRQLALAPNERVTATRLLDENLYFISNINQFSF